VAADAENFGLYCHQRQEENLNMGKPNPTSKDVLAALTLVFAAIVIVMLLVWS